MRFHVAVGALALPLSMAAQQKEGFPPDNPDSWRLAGTAKVFCSAIFVSGRDSAEVRSNLASYFLGARVDSLTAIRIDRNRRLVQLTLAGRLTREAKQYGDQGCVIHQPGKDTVHFTPVRVATSLPDAATTPWPMGDLLPATPLPASIDTAKLRQATDAAFANPAGLTAAFVVVHDGRIIAERYANGAHRDMQLESWSMGKSITGTLIGRLIQLGALRLDQPAPIPNWQKEPGDPRAKIRVMDLMRMSSGLRFSRGSPEDLPGYHDHDLIYTGALDAFEFVSTRPLQFEPNTKGRYRNTDPLLLGLIVRDAVRKRGEEYLTWPQRELFDRIGIRRQVLETDPYGNFLLSGYDYGTARNWARLGMLYLNDGVWRGQRLLPEGWLTFVSTPAPAWPDSAYGGMVWVNARQPMPLPRDAFAFRGAGGQETWVIPSRRMVIVRMGHFPGSRVGVQELAQSMRLLMEAVPARPLPSGTAREGYVDAGGGVKLFYRVAGSGPDTTIMLHGGPGFTSDYFEKDLAPLAQRHTLIFFDQRGTGRSSLVSDSGALTAVRFADDVEAVRAHFGLRRVALFGHSWGGAIAALYAMRHPDRVSRLLLLGPVPLRRAGLTAAMKALNDRRDSAEMALLAARRAERVAAPASAEACRAYYRVWFRPAFTDSGAMQRSKGDFCFGSPEALANKAAAVDRYTFPSLGEFDWRDALRAVAAPTLIIQAPWEFMPLESAREWRDALRDARLLLLRKGGHFAYLDAPEEFFPAADAFLAGRWPPGAARE